MSDLFEILQQARGLLLLPLVFLVGILGSGHCLLMCVPIASSVARDSIKYYHFGKLVAYFFVGLAIFYFSKIFLQSEIVKISAGLMFLFYFVISFFNGVNHKACMHLHNTPKPAFALGLLNGFLPCAWLYTVFLNLSLQVDVFTFLFLVLTFWLSTLPVYQVLKINVFHVKLLSLFKSKYTRLCLVVVLTLCSLALHYPSNSISVTAGHELLRCYGNSVKAEQ